MEEINKIAHTFMFEFSEEESEAIKKSFAEYKDLLKRLDTIDTSDVQPLVYPFENHFAKLREDETFGLLSAKEALANAAEVRDDQVVVPKVVK